MPPEVIITPTQRPLMPAGIGRNPERLGYAIVTYKCEKCGELMQREHQD
jgi:hypothetical protein